MHNYSIEELEAFEAGFGSVPYRMLENQDNSLHALNKLQQSFYVIQEPKPAMFGGVFLDGDGVLNVNIVENDAHLNKHVRLAMNSENYLINPVDYPISYLESIIEVLNIYLLNRSASSRYSDTVGRNFVSVGLDEAANRVIVELQDISDDAVLAFKRSIIDSPVIQFHESHDQFVSFASVNPGSEIISNNGAASLGYRVSKSDGLKYIIGAGHSFPNGAAAYTATYTLGFCRASNVSGDCDAALIEITNTNYSATNTVQGTSITLAPNATITLPQGATVQKSGKATGVTAGSIISTSVSYKTDNGNILTDITEAKTLTGVAIAGRGDSGGIVYAYSSPTYYAAGIVQGGATSSTSSLTMFYSKATRINTKFAVARC